MNYDEYGRRIIQEMDLINLLYIDPTADLSTLYLDTPLTHNRAIDVNYSDLTKLHELEKISIEPDAWHRLNQTHWYMPDEYKNLDIAAWVLDQCNGNEVELQRCGQELLEYASRGLLPLLQYLKYFVDTLREHKIAWGVGRGSSTASFVLYKIGVHKINAITYQLPLEEFFKELTNG